jgi:outer membrane protein TolC
MEKINKTYRGLLKLSAKKIGGLLILMLSLPAFQGISQTLDDYLIQAAANNPGLKASYTRYQAALERAGQPGLPDPELRAGVFFRPMERFMGNQVADLQLMQMFPWFGMIGTQKEEANQMALAQYQLFLEEKNQLMFQVKTTWHEMTRIQEEIRIMEKNLKILKQFESLALIKFQSAGGNSINIPPTPRMPDNSAPASSSTGGMNTMGGSGSMTSSSPKMSSGMGASAMGSTGSSMNSSGSTMSDVLQIRIEIKELENTLAQLEADLEPLQIRFNKLLNRDIQEKIIHDGSFQPLRLEVGKLVALDSIRKNYPMLAMYDYEMAAYEQQAKMARLDGRPMMGAGVNYMPFTAREENGMMMGGNNMVMPMVTMTLPIYRKKVNSRIKEAELLKESSALERQKTENLLAMEWANAFREWENAERKIELYTEQTNLTQQNLDLMITSYSANQVSLLEVLAIYHQFHDYELKQLNSIYSQYLSLSKLEMLTSSSIPFE